MFDSSLLQETSLVLGLWVFSGVLVALTALRFFKPSFLQDKRQRTIYRAGSILVLVTTCTAFFFIPDPVMAAGLVIGSVLLLVVGLYDEQHSLSPLLQFIFQLLIVGTIVASGWTIPHVTNLFGQGVIMLSGYGIFLAIAWLLILMNVINWFDGTDGLAASMGVIVFVTLLVISLLPATQDSVTLHLSIIGLGSMAAFLVWNFPPARLYLGTTGSWFLGLYIGLVAMIGGGKIATTALVLVLPVCDALVVIAQRLWHKQPPWQGDKRHFHYRLRAKGVSDRSIVLVSILISLGAGLAALYLQTYQKVWVFALLGVCLGVSTLVWVHVPKSSS